MCVCVCVCTPVALFRPNTLGNGMKPLILPAMG